MLDVILLFAGAATLLNGLDLLGKVGGKELSIINLLVGVLQFIVLFIFALTGNKLDPYYGFNLASVLLFSFTYLYLGFTNLIGLKGNGIGAYCLWVAVIALGFGFVCLFPKHDTINAIKWFEWTYLWFLFFYIDKNEKCIRYTGWVAILVAINTLIVPSFLGLTLFWQNNVVQCGWYILTWVTIISLVVLPLFMKKVNK